MMWILHGRGVERALHYLDDYLVSGPATQPDCQRDLNTVLSLCGELGFPVAPEKTEGPTTTRHRCCSSMKKRDLLSSIGLLNHAATVVRPGRAFLWSLIDASTAVRDLDHWVHLNMGARVDLAWWSTFLHTWNGVSITPPMNIPLVMVSDASGSWGCGASYGNLWFQLQWPPAWDSGSITAKELVPIVVGVALWGPYWAGKRIRCLCDNTAVVAAVNRGKARDHTLAHLFRTFAVVTAVLDIRVSAIHLPGVRNKSADALSRNKLPLFLALNPHVSAVLAIIPQELREIVFNSSLHWNSPNWMWLLSASWIAALQLPPAHHTPRSSAAMRPFAGDMECLTPTP